MIWVTPTFLIYVWVVSYLLNYLPINWVTSQWYSFPLMITIIVFGFMALITSISAILYLIDRH